MSKNKKQLLELIICSVLYVICIIVFHFVNLPNNLWFIELIAYLLLYLASSYKVIIKACKNIVRGKILDENFLMLVASIAAFAIKDYKEAIIVMLLYQVGELFESFAVKKTRKDISHLMDIKPDVAVKYEDDKETVLDPSLIKVGDVIIVKVGERIPLDGKIIKGNTTLDTSALTGESLPREAKEGDKVLSGVINNGSVIYVEVEKEYNESTVAKILEMVENASSKKTKTENFITRFAMFYTPIVVSLALVLAIVPPLIDGQWSKWITSAISFLVVSCPCALVISVPLSFFAGIGGISKIGVLIKGSNYLELLDKADTFVFDKTGTLTKGEFVVSKFEVAAGKLESQLFRCAYITESKSNHPLAKSIMKYLEEKAFRLEEKLDAYEVEEIPGLGVAAIKGEEKMLSGNKGLLEKFAVGFEAKNEAGTYVYFAENGEYLGYFLINDKIKDEAKETIDYLNGHGYKTIMLTGDNKLVAESVSKTLNLTEYKAELLPQDKVSALDEIMKNKKANGAVAYVGDGINDAPVLMMADVGISMGAIGSDSAIEASDIVLMKDSLSSIIEAKKAAKRTMRIARENIIFALSVKAIVLILSLCGYQNIWLAVFADVGVSVIAIINAMRAIMKK